jgi:hypothetical protein
MRGRQTACLSQEPRVDPSAIRNLLFNLKLQLLGLPNLAKWGLATFAGIIIARELVTAVWNVKQRRDNLRTAPAVPHADRSIPSAEGPHPLPAPNPLDTHFIPTPDVVANRPPSTPGHGRRTTGRSDAP